VPGRRRRRVELERVLGTPALSATAYGNVGSSIYYALGLTAVFALGLTPVVFVIAGAIFALTALTYTEGTVRFPEAGGSASFARHAFNELASFGAGWAQLLNYVITIAISAFFVPHYLSIFWEPLKAGPWDVVVGAAVVAVLVLVNIVGIQEAVGVNVVLAVVDFATQLLLVLLGLVLVFSPELLADNVHWGTAPTWSSFALAIPVAMIAYTGIETISNLAEEAREPSRSIPASMRLVALAVFAIYLTLPWIALSAMPVERVGGELRTLLALPPEQGGYANDPVLGVVENIGLSGAVLDVLTIYVGLLASTILFVAANAGVIGSSRITYSMAGYRQLPQAFRRLHPTFKTPWLALVVFAGIASIVVVLPGRIDFLGTMYAFGAMLSFTVAHLAVIALRLRAGERDEPQYRAGPNLRVRGVDWPVFAVLGALGTGSAWLVVVVQDAPARYVGLGWLAAGFALYWAYRRYAVRVPLTATVRVPVAYGPALALEYRRLLVPVIPGQPSDAALDVACRLAAERGARIEAVTVIEVPLDRPLTAPLRDEEERANRELDEARAIGDAYGVRVVDRLLRGRSAGEAIVEEARRRGSEIIVLGTPRKLLTARQRAVFGRTVDYVLRNAPCRVMVAARPSERAA
jgi:APA family basic amino acid/polyamine antiporter